MEPQVLQGLGGRGVGFWEWGVGGFLFGLTGLGYVSLLFFCTCLPSAANLPRLKKRFLLESSENLGRNAGKTSMFISFQIHVCNLPLHSIWIILRLGFGGDSEVVKTEPL